MQSGSVRKTPFAERLARLMDEKGLTKNDLARKIWGEIQTSTGYYEPKNRTTLSRYLSGAVTPRPDTVRELAGALDVPFHTLMPESDPINRPGSGLVMEVLDRRTVRLTVSLVLPRTLANEIVERLTPYAA